MKNIFCISAIALFVISFGIFSQSYTSFEISPGLETYYDIQSNGSTHMIEQDPNTTENIHACFTVDLTGSSGFPDRKVYYFFSSDYGNTWTNYGANPSTGRSGFSTMCLVSDGSALMGMNSDNGGGTVRVQWFADIAPGAGTFVRLDPGSAGTGPYLWPIGIPTGSVSNPIKFVFAAGQYLNRGLSLTNSTFSGYTLESDISVSSKCAFARGQGSTIGLAYIAEGSVTPGKVKFKQSTDNGETWSAPLTIWDPAAHNNNGAYNGIDITYYQNTPKVVFESVKYVSGNPDIHSTASIYFWSPNVNSGNPVVLDSSNNLTAANPNNTGFASVCRPVIGSHTNNNLLAVAYCKARTDTMNLNNYFDIYCRYSRNGGQSWSTMPSKVTNNSGPITDNKYVSFSNLNSNLTGPYAIFNILHQKDSIAGNYINGANRHSSKIIYTRILILIPDGINSIGNELPVAYSLRQNFPNPFNPVTFVDFDLPEKSNVKLTIYNASGEVVAVLVEGLLQAGQYRADWNAMHFASGVYFYSIRAGDYFKTRKMVLVK